MPVIQVPEGEDPLAFYAKWKSRKRVITGKHIFIFGLLLGGLIVALVLVGGA